MKGHSARCASLLNISDINAQVNTQQGRKGARDLTVVDPVATRGHETRSEEATLARDHTNVKVMQRGERLIATRGKL